jgi:hypothetical protein
MGPVVGISCFERAQLCRYPQPRTLAHQLQEQYVLVLNIGQCVVLFTQASRGSRCYGTASANTPVTMQQIRSTQQFSNWEALFSTRSVRYLRDATIEELLGEVFSVTSVPRLYNEEQVRLRERERERELNLPVWRRGRIPPP